MCYLLTYCFEFTCSTVLFLYVIKALYCFLLYILIFCICDLSQILILKATCMPPKENPDVNVVMLGTVMPAPTDAGLNSDDKG